MAYRTDRKSELQRNLERLADEDAELEQLAEDLEACSQYKKAEVRLRTKGLSLIESEDYEEAKKYVDTLLQQTAKAAEKRKEKRDYVLGRIKKVAKVVTKTTAALGILAAVAWRGEKWWNANEYAVEALAKYDTPAKIEDLEERKEVISQLDEIFEEHAFDDGSDEAAVKYLKALETKGYSIREGARILNTVGSRFYYEEVYQLDKDLMVYLDFLTTNKIEIQQGECYLDYTLTQNDLIDNLTALHKEGFCNKK